MRVKVNGDRCVGHGMCYLACPEVFALSEEDGHAQVLTEEVPAEHEAAVARAVESCPEGAVELLD